jgi:polar amino acid transport system substrate-binding protein
MNKSTKIHSILFALLVFLSVCTAAEPKKLFIGVEEIDYYPYYRTVKGNYEGFAADLFKAFAHAHNFTIEFKPLPIKRLYVELYAGTVHFKFPDHPFWNKEGKQGHTVLYSNAVAGFTDGVLVLEQNSALEKSSLKQLGFVRGFSAWPFLDDIERNVIQARELNSLESLLMLTLDKRIDGAYFNLTVAQHHLKHNVNKAGTLVLAENLAYDRNNYRASTTNKRAPLAELNAFLQSETAKTLRNQYGIVMNPEAEQK